jgi:hypothetical protein
MFYNAVSYCCFAEQVLSDCGTVLVRDYGLHDHVRTKQNTQPATRRQQNNSPR